MKLDRFLALLALAALTVCGTVAFAADPELPLSWKGDGVATMISEDGTRDIDFEINVDVDKDGNVSGKTSTDDGSSQIERLYFGQTEETEMPSLNSRKVVLALSIRSSDTPLLILMNGQVISDKFCFGELRIGRLNSQEIKDALEIGNKEATAMEGTSLPSGVLKALEETAPIGCFQMTGKFVKED